MAQSFPVIEGQDALQPASRGSWTATLKTLLKKGNLALVTEEATARAHILNIRSTHPNPRVPLRSVNDETLDH